MTEHTRGPWEAILHEDRGTVASHPIRADNKSIAAVWCRFGKYRVNAQSLAEGRANARLMAAAPDMLTALRNVQALISEAAMTGFNHKDGDWAERLFASQQVTSAAIKQATGSHR